ncbi:efflux RND transporter periplasmic adaptor subunit [Crocosphaera sp. UHCC 0190]|uniref:efflux RND transporter periplasmic adaptor subunit n=1 Tax=Crocosphaera sp. UHCC 0190 TaxID=3110246 RepID=UPI002B202C32|nr:efflux RND transporter periplasmic adaptor subunit [Crocosphaera sp. UHCC 0190]MEA5512378.1 efflux RND transporter periplasmic adaptor subunit [Crocosphaera sp. UHCC 0190]
MEVPVLGKLNRPLPWILAAMTGGILLVGGLTYKMVESPTTESKIDQMTVVAQRETLAVEIEASGTVEPIDSVNISPKNPGRLVQLRVEQGMPVKQGQILAVMENTEVRAEGKYAEANYNKALADLEAARVRIPSAIQQAQTRYAQAQAQFQETQANLERAKQRIPKDLDQIKAQIISARSQANLAASRVKRNQELLQQGAITQDRFDEIMNDSLNAQANLVELEKKLEQTENTANPEVGQLQQAAMQAQAAVAETNIAFEERKQTAKTEIAQLEAGAAAAKAQLEKVAIQFQDTAIRAPFDGVVTQKYATPGAFVTPTTSASSTASATSSSILAIARGLEIVAKVPEVDIAMIQPGQPVTIKADAYPNEEFQGQVIRIAPEAIVEQNVTSFEVTIGLITGRDKLLSKMNVDVMFLGQEINEAVVIPTVAIVTQEGETGVMVPDADNNPKFRSVTIGQVLDDKTQILSGLNPGERVFIDIPEPKDKK